MPPALTINRTPYSIPETAGSLFSHQVQRRHRSLRSEKAVSYGYPIAIRWQEEGRIFIVHFDGGNLSTFLPDGSQRQDAPFNPSTGTLNVSSFGLIWGWTDKGSENEGAWISGPGLTSTQILNGPAAHPVWNIDNDLLFFVGQDLYRATFNRFYTDPAPVASLTGDVLDAAWWVSLKR